MFESHYPTDPKEQEYINHSREVRKRHGRRIVSQARSTLRTNDSPEIKLKKFKDFMKNVDTSKNKLRPGEVKIYDKKTQSWKSNLDK